MILKTNLKILITFFVLSAGFTTPVNGQLWKKLKKKVQTKIEQNIEKKVDKETDKVIDKTLEGKKEKEDITQTSNIDNSIKSYGTASINHSTLYGTFRVDDVTKTKVNKEGEKVSIIGYWRTSDVDVFDGYKLIINKVENIDNLKNKTFKIPEEATLKLAYNALLQGTYSYERDEVRAHQNMNVINGTVSVTFNKDKNFAINFSGNVKLHDYKNTNSLEQNIPSILKGTVTTTSPEYTITKPTKVKKSNTNDFSDEEKTQRFKEALPTVDIPSTFNFNKRIEVKMTDERGETQNLSFLIGSYPDIYGISVKTKEMQGQEMLVVNTPKSSTIFMSMAGMKIKKTTSLEQIGSQIGVEDKLPEDGDFDYRKTGETKMIIGYLCEEFKVDYEYTNQIGSTSFWVSKDFPIQNKSLPMLGMKMNNPNLSGFVLEINTTNKDENFKMEIVNISDKSVKINTNEYKKMGF
ncbi:protein of unknown function [Polaribacter sp. KT25b]|uniref:DUF4412 domain-containing protein n=1 Tax=Polaribacter sp. KT25b TaxID=1855336 RepID=UPI00087B6108|nr:DUF4412 domain-containing protein [Polaribacter sp. KT25b]SDR92429.1 protein of unknown function [Polaribacter sp. KT25b]